MPNEANTILLREGRRFQAKAQADTYDDLQNPTEPLDVDSE